MHVHDYLTIKETKDGLVKRCRICKKKISFTKDSVGRVDNKRYLKEHARNFAQPFGRTGNLYRRIYGNPDPKKFEYKPKEVAQKEAKEGWKDMDKITKDILTDKKYV